MGDGYTLLDVMLNIINNLLLMITPLSPRSRPRQQVTQKKYLFITFLMFNYYYYSHRDCGKIANYCYTVPLIWHHFGICYYNYYIKYVYMYIDANWK